MTVGRRSIVALGLALACLFLLPSTASAHAAFVSSQPEPGERVESTPGVVRLTFSEPLNPRLSRTAVLDPTGRSFETTALTDRSMSVQLGTNAPGVYEVRWTTVSPLDGHTLRGSFRFGVRVTPEETEAVATSGPQASDVALAVGRAVEYAGLLGAGGMLLLIALARRPPRLEWVRPRLRMALAAALVGGVAVVGGEVFTAAGSLRVDGVLDYLTAGLSGWARVVRLGAEAAALLASFVGVAWTSPAVAVSLGSLAAAGHAAALRPAWWGITVDAAHLALASLWAGGILALATVRPTGGWRGDDGHKLLERFTPVALYAFSLTVATGILRATQELAGWADLVTSSYGRVLGAKIVGVAAMLPLSMRAWKRLAGSVRGEATVALAVIAAAALLAAYPLPPGRAEEAEESVEQAAGSRSAVPQPGDITLGEGTGRTVVGLTLRPGEPGRNEALLFLLPMSGAEGAEDMTALIKLRGRRLDTQTCGTTCRRAEVALRGGEVLRVRVDGPEGGVARFEVPTLPAPDGGSLLEAATDRMESLETLRMSETLGPADPLFRSEYSFAAPDRMRIDASNRYELIVIGRTQYQRARGGSRWNVSTGAPPLNVPLLTWSGFEPVATRVVGTESIEGRDATVVSFFTGDVENPIWFRLWIDHDRIVHRMEMRAIGHFMDQRFHAFDTAVDIRPPS